MARATYGGILTDLKGSIGGLTFQHNHSGKIVRLRPTQLKNKLRTTLASQRNLIQRAIEWNALSSVQKGTWGTFANSNTFTNRYNEVKTLSAFNWYVSINNNRILCGGTATATAPTATTPDAVPVFTADFDTTQFKLTPASPYALGNNCLVIYATVMIRDQFTKQRNKFRYLMQINSGTITIVDLKTAWQNLSNYLLSTFTVSAVFNVAVCFEHIEKTSGLATIGKLYNIPFNANPPFSPSTLTNLIAWYKSDVGITKDAGDLVSQWDDQSGFGNHLVQASGTKQPLFQTNRINTLPSIYFDGSDDAMNVAIAGLVQPQCVYMVFFNKFNSTCYIYDSLGSDSSSLIQFGTTSIKLYAGSYGPTLANFPDQTWALLSSCINSTNSWLLTNKNTKATGDCNVGNSGGINFGSNAFSIFFAEFEVAEIIITHAVPTTDELLNIQNYVSSRYGITM